MTWQMASPRPLPPGPPLRAEAPQYRGSKSCGSCPGGTPGALSSTTIHHYFATDTFPYLQRWRRAALAGLALCGALLALTPAQAHLMAAQKGTLNIVGDAAFLVLSVAELHAHTDAVRRQVQAGVQLHDGAGALPLQLVMLDVAPPENTTPSAARHLAVVGRFQLRAPAAQPAATAAVLQPRSLTLTFTLFGTATGKQQQDLAITRQPDPQWLRFTPCSTRRHAAVPARCAPACAWPWCSAVRWSTARAWPARWPRRLR
jgi:hypothetical protein